MRYLTSILFTVIAIFCLQTIAFTQIPNKMPDISGKWQGELTLPKMNLTLIIKIQKNSAGNYSATLDVPQQGAKDISIDKVIIDSNSVELKIPIIKATYIGTLMPDSNTISGNWKQGGASLTLQLVKTDKDFIITRKQDPIQPLSYNEENVTIANSVQNVLLSGSLTFPKAGTNFPAVILISGSGQQNRNEEIFGHRPFLVLSDYLTRMGIAVLRVDDRGIGASTGNFTTSTTADFATDVAAEVEYLKTRKEINPKKIGLIGHSEGGLVAPMVAVSKKEIEFIVLIAGPGLSGDKILLLQTKLLGNVVGNDSATLANSLAFNESIYKIVKEEKDSASAYKKLHSAYSKFYAAIGKGKSYEKNDIEKQIKAIQTPWFKFFLTYDPIPTLEKIKCPVLAINGEKDVQVPPKENLAAINKALKKSRNSNFKTVELKGLNHLLQPANTGSPSEYAGIDITIAPEALEVIGRWIETVNKK